MTSEKIAILGAGGMLGSDLKKVCCDLGLETASYDLPDFDITDTVQLKDVIAASDIVINCAAYTNVDLAQSEPDIAKKVNTIAAGELGKLATEFGVWALHISTDFVFDGEQKSPYIETDIASPLSVYGKTKFDGEQLFLKNCPAAAVMRVQWTYGNFGDNFPKKMISLAQTRDYLQIVDDQIGSPTSTVAISKAICQLIDEKPAGLFHFANGGYVSRFELAKFIFKTLNIDVELKACKSSEFETPAKRPLNSRFNCDKISKLLDEPIENWALPLEEFLRQL